MHSGTESIVVFSDFDGTITEDESFVAVLQHFAPELSSALLPEIYALRLSVREGVRRIVESIPSARFPEILEFVDGVPLREGFAEFLSFVNAREIPFIIISGGLEELIRKILGPLASRIGAIYAARVDRSGAFLKAWSNYESNTELVSKPMILQRHGAAKAVCIGDSVTDLEMAMRCPNIFARDRLAQYLTERGHPFFSYETFFDIRMEFERVCGHDAQDRRHA